MKRKRHQKTTLQKAYQKERRRLQNIIYRGRKQGYIFKENVIPSIPKRVTQKSLQKIRELTSKDLYKKAEYLNINTGELIPALTRKAEVKQEGIKKGKATKALRKKQKKLKALYMPEEPTTQYEMRPTSTNTGYIDDLQRFRSRLVDLVRVAKPDVSIEERRNELVRIFDETLAEYENEQEYLQHLLNHEFEITQALDQIAYDSGDGDYNKLVEEIKGSFVELGAILNTAPLSPFQAERLSEESEYGF